MEGTSLVDQFIEWQYNEVLFFLTIRTRQESSKHALAQ